MKKKCPKCKQNIKVVEKSDGQWFPWHTDKMGFTCDNIFKKV